MHQYNHRKNNNCITSEKTAKNKNEKKEHQTLRENIIGRSKTMVFLSLRIEKTFEFGKSVDVLTSHIKLFNYASASVTEEHTAGQLNLSTYKILFTEAYGYAT